MAATAMLTAACGLIAAQFHHQLGIAPILGAILCAACFLRPKDLFIVGIGGMLIRDLLLGFSMFTAVRVAGIALVVAALVMLKVRPSWRSLLAGLLIAAPLYHLSLAAGNWATGTCGDFAMNAQGFVSAIGSSLPYMQRSFAGDLLFTALFLGAYSLAAQSWSWSKSIRSIS